MRTSFFVIAALTLAGCSNTPGGSDVERVLETATAGCQNVEIVDVEKNNSYEKEGATHVEYSYTVQVKDTDALSTLRENWRAEQVRDAEYKPARAEYERQESAITAEIERIEARLAESRPGVSQFSASGNNAIYMLSDSERQAYDAAQQQWQQERSAATQAKHTELDELKRAWNDSRDQVPQPTVFGREGNAIHAFLSQGCSSAGWRYASGLFDTFATETGKANAAVQPGAARDRSPWFEAREARMSGVMPMHKTENGWRALSESM